MAVTQQIYHINNLLGLWNRTTEEMFNIQSPFVGATVFNTDLQKPVYYTLTGWADAVGTPILHNLFYEDFETDLSAWTLVNDTTNKWMRGDDVKYAGTYSAYISNDNTHAQYNNSQAQISHIYKEFSLPDSEQIKLSLFAKIAGETGYDYMRVYWLPQGTLPTAGSLPNSSYLISDTLVNIDWTEIIIDISDKKNTTGNLVITHRNDSSVGANPGGCVDNIRIDYK